MPSIATRLLAAAFLWFIPWGLIAIPGARADSTPSMIVPGVQVGPVRLGMAAADASAAASRFQAATGCEIDLQIVHGTVIAAGSAWGGCLDLQLPAAAAPLVVQIGQFIVPLTAGIGGSADALIAAFGTPMSVTLSATETALVWPQGLVTHTVYTPDGGIVTYLAVVSPETTAVPPIGQLAPASGKP